MKTDDEMPTVALSDYLGVVTRRWRVVLAGALLGAMAAAGFLALSPTTATATSVVNIAAITSEPYSASRSASGLVDMQTEAQAVQSMAVAERAAGLLGDGTEPRDIRGRLSVSAIDSTTIIRISVTSLSPARAQAQADAVAAAFLEYRSTQATERITSVLRQDEARLEALREQLREANERLLAAESGSLDAVQAETDRQLLTLQVNAVLDRTSSFEGIDTSGGQILTPATANALAYAPERFTVGAGGLLAGAALGLVGAFVRQARDRRIHLGADVVAAGVGPVVARLTGPTSPRSGHDVDQLEIAREWALSSAALGDGHGVLAFLEDRSTAAAWDIAADLARVVAESEHPVHVVAVPTTDGYTERLLHRLGLDPAEADDRGALASATLPSLTAWVPGSLSWSGATRREVDGARETTLVLLVCPATASDADRMTVCRIADAALVFAAEQVSQRAGLQELAAMAESMDCAVIGSVTSVTGHRRPAPGHRSRADRKAWPATGAPEEPLLPRIHPRHEAETQAEADGEAPEDETGGHGAPGADEPADDAQQVESGEPARDDLADVRPREEDGVGDLTDDEAERAHVGRA